MSITIHSQAALDAADSGTTAVELRYLSDDERSRIDEIAAHPQIQNVTVDGRDPEHFLVISLQPATDLGIYEVLAIDSRGDVAEYATNQPRYFPTFVGLLKAAQR